MFKKTLQQFIILTLIEVPNLLEYIDWHIEKKNEK